MTRKEHLVKCKKLLYSSNLGVPLEKEDSDYLLTQIFPLHRKWKEKTAGKEVYGVIVHSHPVYKNRCFALLVRGGEPVDISFLECINRPGLVKDIEGACLNALDPEIEGKNIRPLVSSWVKTFDNEELTVGKYVMVDVSGKAKFTNVGIIENFKKYYNENV